MSSGPGHLLPSLIQSVTREVIHMLKKGRMVGGEGNRLSRAEQFYYCGLWISMT
jgi:hypothetical protein